MQSTLTACFYVFKWSQSSAEWAQPSEPPYGDSLGLTSPPRELVLVSCITCLIILLLFSLPFPPPISSG